MNKYPLSIATSYCSHWTIQRALLELLQNAVDESVVSGIPFDFEVTEGSYPHLTVKFTNYETSLKPMDLLLGTTDKADNNEVIGKFGEGFKLALLVLLRANLEVVIHNADTIWTPAIEYNELFDSEILVISEEDAIDPTADLTFEVKGLLEGEVIALRSKYLFWQEANNIHITSCGTVLLDECFQGKVYVNGVHLTDTRLTYGYDIPIDHIVIDSRDREHTSLYEIQFSTSKIWAELFDIKMDKCINLMLEGAPDLCYIPSALSTEQKDKVYQYYKETYGSAYPVVYQSREKELELQYTNNFVVLPSTITNIIEYHASFTTDFELIPKDFSKLPRKERVVTAIKLAYDYCPTSVQTVLKELEDETKSWKD